MRAAAPPAAPSHRVQGKEGEGASTEGDIRHWTGSQNRA